MELFEKTTELAVTVSLSSATWRPPPWLPVIVTLASARNAPTLVEGACPVARIAVVAAELVMDTPGPVPTICTPAGSWATMVPNPAACDRVYVPGGTLIETVPA